MKTIALIAALLLTSTQAQAGGAGGKFGGGGAGGSWGNPVSCKFDSIYTSATDAGNANCSHYGKGRLIGWYYTSPDVLIAQGKKSGIGYPKCSDGNNAGGFFTFICDANSNQCSDNQHYDQSTQQCVPDSCPEGQHLENGTCVPDDNDPECGQGQHLENGICVNDPPQDCDPAIQECDENGKPKCDCCEKLDTIIGNQRTQITNQSKMIQGINTTNSKLDSVNQSIQTTNSKLDIANQKLDAIKQAIIDKQLDLNTDNLENKLDEILQAIQNKELSIDLNPTINKLDEILQAIKENKYDDSELQAKIDEVTQAIIDKQIDLTPVTERQDETKNILNTTNDKLDEQTTILDDIRDMFNELLGREPQDPNQPKPPDPLDLAEQQYDSNYDPWGAIRGFDIGQNRINASNQCPADKTVTILGGTLTFKMGYFCDFLAMLAPAFLAIAYIMGGIIIVRGSD